MKKILLAAFACFSISCALAQTGSPKLSIGPEVALPLGSMHDDFSAGVGGSLKLDVPLSNSGFNITLTAGYTDFLGKNISMSTLYYNYSYKIENSAYIPVKIGGKYYYSKTFYVEGQVGAVHTLSNMHGSGTAFAYSPGVGLALPVSNKNAFDIGLRYEGWSGGGIIADQLALRLAYSFGK